MVRVLEPLVGFSEPMARFFVCSCCTKGGVSCWPGFIVPGAAQEVSHLCVQATAQDASQLC